MRWVIRRSMLVLLLSPLVIGRGVAGAAEAPRVPPQADGWSEYSNTLGPDARLTIRDNRLVFPNIGFAGLVYDSHYDRTQDFTGGDLYRVSSVVLSRRVTSDYRPDVLLGCGGGLGAGFVLLSEGIDRQSDRMLLSFSSVRGTDTPKMIGGNPEICKTSVWISH